MYMKCVVLTRYSLTLCAYVNNQRLLRKTKDGRWLPNISESFSKRNLDCNYQINKFLPAKKFSMCQLGHILYELYSLDKGHEL